LFQLGGKEGKIKQTFGESPELGENQDGGKPPEEDRKLKTRRTDHV